MLQFFSANISKDAAEKQVLAEENVQSFIDGKTVRKVIVVPGKLVNIVANWPSKIRSID